MSAVCSWYVACVNKPGTPESFPPLSSVSIVIRCGIANGKDGADRQDLQSRHDINRHPQEYPSRHCVGDDLEHIHFLLADLWLRHCPGWFALLLLGWDQIKAFFTAASGQVKALWSPPSPEEAGLSTAVRRGLFVGLGLFIVAFITVEFAFRGEGSLTQMAARTP